MRSVLGVVALVACTSLASAADLGGPDYGGSLKDAPVAAAPFKWTGFYLGGNVGYSWGHLDTTDNSVTTNGALFGIPGAYTPAQTFAGSDSSAVIEGMLGGVQVGYNIQISSLVVGIEGAFHLADLVDQNSYLGSDLGPYYKMRSSLDYFGTLTARIGYAFDRALVYGLAGVAIGRGEGQLEIIPGVDPTNPGFSDKVTETLVGVTVGGGVEVALTDAWSAKVEYQFTNFNSERFDFKFANSDGSTATTRADLDVHHVKAGLNYRF